MKALCLAVLLLAPAAGAAERKRRAPAKPSATLDAAEDTVKLADIVAKTPTAELDPVLAGAFLKVDIETLPKRQRALARGKQLELRALITVAEGKKKGGIRQIGPEACKPPKVTPADVPMLMRLGFVEAQDWAVGEAGTQTECTELDMQCQFSLLIVDYPKGTKPPRRFYFQEKDPMLVIVQMKEKAMEAKQTGFFGVGFLKCQH